MHSCNSTALTAHAIGPLYLKVDVSKHHCTKMHIYEINFISIHEYVADNFRDFAYYLSDFKYKKCANRSGKKLVVKNGKLTFSIITYEIILRTNFIFHR